jgi:hypothetical protein
LAFISFARRFIFAFFSLSALQPAVIVKLGEVAIVFVADGTVDNLAVAMEALAIGCARSLLLSVIVVAFLSFCLVLSCAFSWRIRARG